MINQEIKAAFESFQRGGNIVSVNQITAGLINATYLIETDKAEKYILQKINTFVFKSILPIKSSSTAVIIREKISISLLATAVNFTSVMKMIMHGECISMLMRLLPTTIPRIVKPSEMQDALSADL